jgi:hypothetical protein
MEALIEDGRVRRNDETLNALLKRLDRAIGTFYDDGEVVDEINCGASGSVERRG